MTVANIALIAFIAIIAIILGFAFVLLVQVWRKGDALLGLVSEPPDANGVVKASLSRFQMLIFTFVIAGLYLLLSIEAGAFVEIPANVLGLLGISSGSYVISKAVGKSDGQGKGGGGQGGGA